MRTDDQYPGATNSTALGESYRYGTVPLPTAAIFENTSSRPDVRSGFRYTVVKRTVDIFGCLALAPLLLPLCGIVILLIKFSSPGPAFFSHRRISKNGGFFSMWKFRTMCVNSDEVLEKYLASNTRAKEEWGRAHKLRKDPRVTRIGRFLRRYSLDELPQFWNVLRGDMSLVGPRPIIAAEVGKYGSCFACYCSVKSGMTGLWQVSGRSKVTYAERIALDCNYVREWSLWQDVKILAKTVSCFVDTDGAY